MQYFTSVEEIKRVRTETTVVYVWINYSALSSDNGECHKRFSVGSYRVLQTIAMPRKRAVDCVKDKIWLVSW